MNPTPKFALIAALSWIALAAAPARGADPAQPQETNGAPSAAPRDNTQEATASSAQSTPKASAQTQRDPPVFAAKPDTPPRKVQRPDFSLANMQR